MCAKITILGMTLWGHVCGSEGCTVKSDEGMLFLLLYLLCMSCFLFVCVCVIDLFLFTSDFRMLD